MKLMVALILTLLISTIYAQPEPGDVFREYIWNNTDEFLRVGGDLDYGGDFIYHSTDIDLVDAIKAEVVIEKLQSHEGTTDLEIDINEKGWIPVPISELIKHPPTSYMHHIYSVISIPLSYLNQGLNNKFRMKVNPNQPWGWPQNIIYGVHFRIYYDPAKKAHPTGSIVSPTSGSNLGGSVQINATVNTNGSSINKVEFIGKYEDVDYDGDGVYREWHYHYISGKLSHHLGTDNSSPYSINWNTSWVPDQFYPFEIAARIVDNSGMIYFTEPVSELQLDRTETSIVLLKPYDISESFVTRKPDRSEKFFIRSDVDRFLASQMVWTSWSPGHAHGIYINDNYIMEKEGPTHKYYFHRVNISNMNVYIEQENNMTFGRTEPGHHGMEVQWPGIMHLIKVDFSQTDKSAPASPDNISVMVDETGIRIDWNDRADNEKGFLIERKDGGESYTVVGKVSWVDRPFFIDDDYRSNVTYTYKVTAYNEYGSSSSEEIPITTPSQKSFLDFSNQDQYAIGDNWINYNAGFYYLYDFRGVERDFGVLKPIYNRPFTSTFISNSYSYQESNFVGQNIFIKSKTMNELNVDAFNFGLLSEIGDELYFDSSDSSFVAISLTVPEDINTWRMKCYSKTSSNNYEIVDSTSSSFTPDSELWYKLNVSWEKSTNDSIAYTAILDEYDDGAYFITRKEVLKLSGKLSNESIIADDSIFAAIVGNDQAGIDAVDNFLVYDVPDSTTTSIDDDSFISVPEKLTLCQNYPNPFNPSTTIEFSLPKTGNVKLEIFNVLGQRVATLVNENKAVGAYSAQWNASSMASGLYFYSLIFDGTRHEVRKMLLLK